MQMYYRHSLKHQELFGKDERVFLKVLRLFMNRSWGMYQNKNCLSSTIFPKILFTLYQKH